MTMVTMSILTEAEGFQSILREDRRQPTSSSSTRYAPARARNFAGIASAASRMR